MGTQILLSLMLISVTKVFSETIPDVPLPKEINRSNNSAGAGLNPTTTSTTTTITLATPTPCKCGRKGDSNPVGIHSGLHEFPWQCAVVVKTDLSEVICGAVLINTQYVATAAHCVKEIDPSHLKLGFGEHDLSTTNDTSETQYRDISNIIIHPDYNPDTQDNDFALLEVSIPVNFETSDAVIPICFPNPSNLYDNKLVTVTGWGLFTVSTQPDVLQNVDVTTLTNTACREKYPYNPITANMICAEYNGQDSCQGDNGGWAMIYQEGGHSVLVGIMSFDTSCGNPGIYTRFGNYIDWINDIVDPAKTCKV